MNAEFNWWLLIVGLVIGAGLVWLILADGSRREADVAARERASEARWIAEELRHGGRRVDEDVVADVLDFHALYLSAPPPDEPEDDVESRVAEADPRWWATDSDLARRTLDERTRPDGRSADMDRADGASADSKPPDASATDWAPVRTPSDRPRSDGRDQPSPSRTG